MSKPLTLGVYQALAAKTDRTRGRGASLELPLLGLFGEVGSLLSEVKKKQRDTRSYLGYEASVLEEMGDVLWYLAVIADRAGLSLTEIVGGDRPGGSLLFDDISFASLQPQRTLPLLAPTTAFERTLMRLAGKAGALVGAHGNIVLDGKLDDLKRDLSSLFSELLEAANEAGVTLDHAASHNLEKTFDRWPIDKKYAALFDEGFPPEEQLPRALTVEIFERVLNQGEAKERRYVIQRCNGVLIGDRLTDNVAQEDDYRFHDAFHYAYAAVLGWSPVTRALFRLKRKSAPDVDEAQDGARALLTEEGIATFIFGFSKQLEFFAGQSRGDLSFTLLKTVRQFVKSYEVQRCPLWQWEEAILSGHEAFRFLKEYRRGTLHLDLIARTLRVEALST
ncbi:NTP pyrophosphatase (non-canonical NTP hydrolase) [Bradyrhizobium sp. S3.9.2]|uniref:nucleoside triphosphate pyrophosphohydrolase family protein n=1 Tax=Bradyrhizobium sp. S3.9.2 TaxID=3156432 RepID=UPI0033912727